MATNENRCGQSLETNSCLTHWIHINQPHCQSNQYHLSSCRNFRPDWLNQNPDTSKPQEPNQANQEPWEPNTLEAAEDCNQKQKNMRTQILSSKRGTKHTQSLERHVAQNTPTAARWPDMKPVKAEQSKHPTSAPSSTLLLTPLPPTFFSGAHTHTHTHKHTAVNTLLTHSCCYLQLWILACLSPCLHTHTHTHTNEHLHVLGCWFLNWHFNRL